MNVFITGATGFIGSHLLQAFASTHDNVAVLTRDRAHALPQRIKAIHGDLNDVERFRPALRDFAPDVCIHLAWSGIPNYSAEISKRNLYGSLQLVDALLSDTTCRRFVGAGTCMEYGAADGECVEEQPAAPPSSFIAWAKRALYEYLLLKNRERPVATYWLRFFYVYGDGQRTDALLPTVVRDLRAGRRPAIRNPRNAQDFVHVTDVVDVIRFAMATAAEPGVYNVGTGTATSVLDMCRFVEDALGVPRTASEALAESPRAASTHRFWASTKKIMEGFGWRPRIAIGEGVRAFVSSEEARIVGTRS